MKNKLKIIIKLIVSGTLLYIIFLKIDINQLAFSFNKGDITRLSAGVVLGVGFNLVKFMKWHYLINVRKDDYSFLDGVKSYMIGNALGMVTPMRAGDLGRALYFDKDDRSRIMGLTIMDRFAELVIVLILSIAGSFVLINYKAGAAVTIMSFAGVIVLYSAGLMNRLFKNILPNSHIGQKLIGLTEMLRSLNNKSVSIIFVYSLVAFVICVIELFFLVAAFSDISLVEVSIVAPLITLSSILPVSLMGLGVREGISIVLLGKFGVSAPAAVSAAFLLFVINNVTISGVGIIFLSKVKFKNTEIIKNTGTIDEIEYRKKPNEMS